MKSSSTKQLTVNALLAALCAVLGYVALDIGNFKLTFESVPVLMAGLMYGPLSGVLVGGVGTFIYQLLRYGMSATTALWILPYIMTGLISGLYAKKAEFMNTNRQLRLIIMLMELLIFVLNSFVIYIDSIVYSYYSPVYVFGTIPLRFVVALIKGVAFGALIPIALRKLARITHTKAVRSL